MDDIARDPRNVAQGEQGEQGGSGGAAEPATPVPFALRRLADDGVEPGAVVDDGGGAAEDSPTGRLPRVLPLPAPPLEMEMVDDDIDDDGDGDDELPVGGDDDEQADAAGIEPRVPPPAPTDAELEAVAEPITDPGQLDRVLLGILLTHREGVTVLRLAQTCDCSQQDVRDALDRIEQRLGGDSRLPLEVARQGDTVKLWTAPDVYPWLERMKGIRKAERLSPAALETLAVIAYRQPVFRAEIEAIRGVKVGPILRTLLEHKLVRVVGRADVPGRPLQYGTSQLFLERFGLRSLADLPSVKEFRQL